MAANNTVSIALSLIGLKEFQSGLNSAAGGVGSLGNAVDGSTTSFRNNMASVSSCTQQLQKQLERLQTLAAAWFSFKQVISVFQTLLNTSLEYNKALDSTRLGMEMQGLTGTYAGFLNAVKGR